MRLAAVVMEGLVAVLAARLARTRAEHRPIAALLAAAAAADIAAWALAALVLAPARAELGAAPYQGAARMAFHGTQATFLLWPAGLAACASAVWLPRARGAVAGVGAVYGLSCAGVVLAYPALRGAALAQVYLAAQLAAAVVVVGAGVAWWRRRARPTFSDGSMLLLGAYHVAVLVASRAPFTGWDLTAGVLVVMYSALAGMHGERLWAGRSWA